MSKEILWRVTIIFISQIMHERGGLFRAKEDDQKENIYYKGNEGIYFGD